MSRRRFDASQLRITRGALVVLGLQLGFSLVWMLSGKPTQAVLAEWLVASPSSVFHEWKVWTLATSPFVENDFLSLLLNLFMLWTFVPTLERFWGTPRFYRFFAITALAGTVGGTLLGLALGNDVPIIGLSPFIFAAIVAFGIIYAKQPVQFFGVLPLTGRQLMYGFLAFLVLYVVLQLQWEKGASFAAAMLAAVLLVSKRLSPGLALKRWRIARARARLSVIEGGAPKRKRDERYLN
ncbi:MAG TPA: rhomboid family intramembrane serine protease [Kofleriaceae bacterium]